MFNILIVGGPAEKYIDKCLGSLVGQTCKEWKAQVVLDPVGDKTYEHACRWKRANLGVSLNDSRKFAISNFIKAISILNPADDDVLVTLDGDDWLASPEALATVKRYYDAQPNLLLTHGSWRAYPNPHVNHNNAPYSEQEFKMGIRKTGWHASHLRTFKFRLWKNIKDEDLRNHCGEYFQSAWDLAMIYPMMEMAGIKRIRFIPEILYIYNQETPFSDTRTRLVEQMFYTNYISAKKPYSYIENL
jgi:glycosyltransferase involved in cell wall biosynthesis